MPLPVEFCFAHEDLFLIPAEELSAGGLSAPFAARLLERGTVTEPWLQRFDEAFALYWRRARELAALAPRSWLPPRAQNVCVALDPVRVRPFFQPLGRSSCLLDHGDFLPRTSSLEFATYQLFHVERQNLLQQVVPALLHDLGYWLVRSQAELDDFRAGCRRARDGQAQGWRALMRALEWIPRCFAEGLKPPPAALAEPTVTIPGTAFLALRSLQGELDELQRKWREAAEQRTQDYFAAHASRRDGDARELVEWIQGQRPLVLVTGQKGELLWDPERPEDVERLRHELSEVTTAAAASLRLDWSVVGARSRAFLDSLLVPDELPAPGPQIDQNGLAYIHRERKLVAYNIHEPGMQRLREPAVPFERWMLGARTIHEWGHLAVEAGYVPVPAQRATEFETVRGELTQLFDAIVADTPAPLRAHAGRQLAALGAGTGSVGRGLVAPMLERMNDWQSNLLAQRYLTPEERETYVRNNVRPLLNELDSTQLFQALARYAFEYQYLAFSASANPRATFLASTWFGEQFLARDVLSESRLDELLATVGRLCRCHEIDTTRFRWRDAPPL